jgi:hypothetical protein
MASIPGFRRILIPVVLLACACSASAGTPAKQVEKQAPPPAPDRWEFRIEPYGWLTGLQGTTGVAGYDVGFDVGFDDIIDNIKMAAALQFEARKGRWGILVDGFYSELTGGSNPPGPLYSTVDAEMQQLIGELAVAYRILEGPHGFVDLLAGARLNATTLDIDAEVSSTGVKQFSQATVDRLSEEIAGRVRGVAQAKIPELQAAIDSAIAAELEKARARVGDAIRGAVGSRPGRPDINPLLARELSGIPGLLPPGLTAGDRDRILSRVGREYAELVSAVAEERVAAVEVAVKQAKNQLKNELEARARQRAAQARARVAKAEAKLQKALEKELTDRLPTHVSGDEWWVDPFVGVRAQWNLTRRLFLAARADVGGFGVGSELAYQLQGTLGFDVTESFFMEGGYRYLNTDYQNGGFLHDAEQAGAFIGFGFRL